MTPAELRVIRSGLGLSGDQLATVLRNKQGGYGINARVIRQWESGDAPIPDYRAEEVEALETLAATQVGQVVDALNDAADPVLVSYRSDTDMWDARPEVQPFPASWWRMILWRATLEVPGVEIIYPEDA